MKSKKIKRLTKLIESWKIIAALSNEQITRDLLPQKFGRRGMIWTGSLIVIVPYRSLCLLPPIEIWSWL